jgi:NADPH-dependent glutamate synthase beta subunit-like oxidoreductase
MPEGRTHKPVIQSDRCHSCDVCIRGCPAEFIPEYRREEKSLRGVLYRGKLIEKPLRGKVPLPPCQEACPIHQDVRGYVALITEGKFREALGLIRKVNPLPAVCGFVCHHPCEEACLREGVDHPIPIRLLKRFVTEYKRNGGRIGKKVLKKRREKVLVIGSGPAGLTAANDLTLLGFEVTVFEALPVLGGMLTVGIPEFRLPRDILKSEIEGIGELGVAMKTHHPFYFDGGCKTFQKLGFRAVFLSIGAQGSLRLNIEGKHLKGIFSGLEFLRDIHTGRKVSIGQRVIVVGGGNVAVDVSRSIRRLGAKEVRMYCLESRKDIPAIREEVKEAKREGIEIHFQVSPLRIIGKGGKATGVEFMKMGSTQGSTFVVYADTIVTAIGQRVDRKSLKGLDLNRDGTVRVDPGTGETSMKGVFAGGDVVTGPGWVIDAIAAGKKGADSIYRYLT